ncbi:hypothetical protein QJS10_CPA01g02339 [Acorus calamus]|uniref:NADH:ubiquinone reductase (non-electrogenic) n=1 Tax=Acorus calamus TaxID=4465 RepID=A0AAV9FHB2_ACOCL|nr:hypothetical protein QJS10_CPA01g02339 [Acorus calamus]
MPIRRYLGDNVNLNGLHMIRDGNQYNPTVPIPFAQLVEVESDVEADNKKLPGLEPTKPNEKPRVVVLGSGWAGCRFLKGLDTKIYDVIHCKTVAGDGMPSEPYCFKVPYDKLVIASGAEPLTFNINGVEEHAVFLRDVSHAQEIRKKLLLNLMLSESPGISEEEKQRLLHCVVIGGGPTGVEFSGELSDFIMKMSMNGLRQYATNHLTKVLQALEVVVDLSGVRLVRGVVKEVLPKTILLSDGTNVPYGLLVWSTGVGPSRFVKTLGLPKAPGGRIGIDEWLRVPSVEDVFALGDCADREAVLPALAQVAEREGKYLAGLFNRIGKENGGKANSIGGISLGDPFVYQHLGSMASVGRYKALVDLRQSKDAKGLSHAGFVSWLIWRSAYLTRVLSWRNRFYVAVNWATTFVFGRDNSRIG